MTDTFNLSDLQARRDAAIEAGELWECSAAELVAAYAQGERNFYGVDLSGADLRGVDLRGVDLRGAYLRGADLREAYLRGADLRGTNILDAIGIYRAFTPHMSSEGRELCGGITLKEGTLTLFFRTGCFTGDAKELCAAVKKTHDDNIHAEQYGAAIAYMQACFKSDMKHGKWDYLKEKEATS